jgi:hypothetical protein
MIWRRLCHALFTSKRDIRHALLSSLISFEQPHARRLAWRIWYGQHCGQRALNEPLCAGQAGNIHSECLQQKDCVKGQHREGRNESRDFYQGPVLV